MLNSNIDLGAYRETLVYGLHEIRYFCTVNVFTYLLTFKKVNKYITMITL